MIKKIFFFNIIIFFVFIISLEIIARIFHLSDLVGISKNLIVLEKEQHSNAKNVEAIAFSKKVFTDDFGFRVPNKNFNYNIENSSVLIIGDSVSFGVGVKENNSFVGMLRNEFKNLNFLNSSVPGYNAKDYTEVVKKNKNLMDVKDLIFFYILNDISFGETTFQLAEFNKEKKNNENLEFFNELKTNRLFNNLNIFLRNKSVFYMWVRGIVTKPSKRHFYYMYPLYQDKSRIKELKIEIDKLKKITKENDINLFLIILPYEYQTRKNNCNDEFLEPQNVVKNIFINLDVKFKDYTKIFCNHEKPSILFLKHDPLHLSYKGHKLVFNLLEKDLNYLKNY